MYYAHKKCNGSIWYLNIDEFIKEKPLFKDSIIAVKASRSMHLEKIIEYLKKL